MKEITAYCKKCKIYTIHNVKEKPGFFTQCVISLITKFSVSHTEDDICVCDRCGTKRKVFRD